MIRSMTAFSRVSGSSREGGWSVEIRSLNHRFFELSLKIPPAFYAFETRLRELIQPKMRRGKVSLTLQPGSGDDPAPETRVDDNAVRFYLGALSQLKKKFQVPDEITGQQLLELPGVLVAEKNKMDAEKSWTSIRRIVDQAVQQAVKMKEAEGKKLLTDIGDRLKRITRVVQKIEKQTSGNSERYLKQLSERLEKLLRDKDVDQDRVYREAAFLAERADVTEEIVRLSGHLEVFRERLQSDLEVGRELDFLCQEMHREINTLGAKAQLFEIATDVVFIKKEIEKIREQVQNIE